MVVYKRAGLSLEELDRYTVLTLLSALFGARCGEVFLYNFSYYLRHPWEAFIPISFDSEGRHFGFAGMSYHGAILGTLLATFFYANYQVKFSFIPFKFKFEKKKGTKQTFLWLTTPLAFGLMLGFLVRIANFINSEIYGTASNTTCAVLFANHPISVIKKSFNGIKNVEIKKDVTAVCNELNYPPINLEITFKKNTSMEESAVTWFLENQVSHTLVKNSSVSKHIYQDYNKSINYTLLKSTNGAYIAQVHTYGIPRHPVQLYEAFGYLILLLVHFFWWYKKSDSLKDGVIAGSAMVLCYMLRFICEFFKDPFNVVYDWYVPITTGHILSLLTVVGGIVLLFYANLCQATNKERK